ncbi:MAG TPA: copper homeostasis protein CutC [Bacteroidia bacterium]|nr:copper homeostasis protein CutC [Bacteroidia bacterium]
MLLEICVTSVEAALTAQNAGADRIELCDNLSEGGTTPKYEVIKSCRKNLHIRLHVMIRPRPGNFFYSDPELNQMKKEIEMSKELKVDGVVFGILTADKKVDIKRAKKLIELSKPLKVTFHRAYDDTVEPLEALENIIECGADILLTSGQKEKAIEGVDLIRLLNIRAHGRIEIMAGSGINDKNVLEIATKTGIQSFHGSAKKINSANEIVYADMEMIRKMKSHLKKLEQ